MTLKIYERIARFLRLIQNSVASEEYYRIEQSKTKITSMLTAACPWWGEVLSIELAYDRSTLDKLYFYVELADHNNKVIFVVRPCLIDGITVEVLNPSELLNKEEDYADYVQEAVQCLLRRPLPGPVSLHS